MGPLDLAIHLLSFAAPAFGVALLVSLAGRFIGGAEARRRAWWVSFVTNFLAGLAVLAAGLAWFGRDGKMATYAILVLVVATVQWLGARGWRA